MATVNTSPPGPDESKAPLLIGVTTLLYTLSTSLYCTRIYSRVRPTVHLSVDDYFATAAVLFALAEWVLLLIGIHYGVGRHNYFVHPADMEQAQKFLFLSQPPYAWALLSAKLSIIWMLLRLRRGKRAWTIFLYFMMAVVFGTCITMNVFQFTTCRPLAAIWDHSIANPICPPPSALQISIYVTAGTTITTDFILSSLPITFIMHIQRPWRERIALMVVMGLGIVASVASIVKTTLVKDYGVTGDDLMDGVNMTIWSILEVQLAIMASCIPTLKGLFEQSLRRLGLLSSRGTTSQRYHKSVDGSHGMSSVGRRSTTTASTTHRDPYGDFDVEDNSWPLTPPSLQPPHYAGTGVVADAWAGDSRSNRMQHDDGIQVGQTVSVESERSSWAGRKILGAHR